MAIMPLPLPPGGEARALLHHLLEHGDIVGRDSAGRTVILLAVADWALERILTFDAVVGVFHSWAITGNWMWQALVFSHGGSMTTPDETEVAFDGENGQRAMATLARLLDEAEMPDLSHEAARQTFFAGKMGIWTESTSLLRVADEGVGGKFAWRTGP